MIFFLIVGETQCHMIVKAATQYTVAGQLKDSTGAIPHWIKSHLISGMLCWNDEAQIEITSPVIDEKGITNLRLQRTTVPATRSVIIVSLTDDSFRLQGLKKVSDLISENGDMSIRLGVLIDLCFNLIAGEIKNNHKQKEIEANIDSLSSSISKKQKNDNE